MAGTRIDPDWLEDFDNKDSVKCPVCYMVTQVPTTGCNEGHSLCRECYVVELSQRQQCPTCRQPTDTSKLHRNRLAEDLIAKMRMRCKHCQQGEGGWDSEMAPLGQQWCTWRGQVSEFAAHLAVCGREEVQCPCPGCEERMARADVGKHMMVMGAEHLQTVWHRVEEQGRTIAEQSTAIAVLQRNARALTHVFTWSTNSQGGDATSATHTFTDGVRGRCFSRTWSHADDHGKRLIIGCKLEEGPTCTMHFK
jgi:hypothetical protein